MELSKLLEMLVEHNKIGKGYQIQLNSGNLDVSSKKDTGVEMGDLYFAGCSILRNQTLICFNNIGKNPTGQSKDGTNLYPIEINSNVFIDIGKIEEIEIVEDFDDWFYFPSEKVVNVHMLPENDSLSGNRNVITIGFMS